MSLNVTVGTAKVTSDKRQTKLSGGSGNEEKKNEMEYIIVNKNV
jgi:hypothetical protein